MPWDSEEQWHLCLNHVLKFSLADKSDELEVECFLSFQKIAFLPIILEDTQRVVKVLGFEWYFFSSVFNCPGCWLIVEAFCSFGISRVIKERGTISETQRVKIFCDVFSLRCVLQIAFPQLREIISVTLVTVESSPLFESLFSLM